jgi:hypothetical protein
MRASRAMRAGGMNTRDETGRRRAQAEFGNGATRLTYRIGERYNQPFCRASRYASMRLPTPSLPIASDR